MPYQFRGINPFIIAAAKGRIDDIARGRVEVSNLVRDLGQALSSLPGTIEGIRTMPGKSPKALDEHLANIMAHRESLAVLMDAADAAIHEVYGELGIPLPKALAKPPTPAKGKP